MSAEVPTEAPALVVLIDDVRSTGMSTALGSTLGARLDNARSTGTSTAFDSTLAALMDEARSTGMSAALGSAPRAGLAPGVGVGLGATSLSRAATTSALSGLGISARVTIDRDDESGGSSSSLLECGPESGALARGRLFTRGGTDARSFVPDGATLARLAAAGATEGRGGPALVRSLAGGATLLRSVLAPGVAFGGALGRPVAGASDERPGAALVRSVAALVDGLGGVLARMAAGAADGRSGTTLVRSVVVRFGGTLTRVVVAGATERRSGTALEDFAGVIDDCFGLSAALLGASFSLAAAALGLTEPRLVDAARGAASPGRASDAARGSVALADALLLDEVGSGDSPQSESRSSVFGPLLPSDDLGGWVIAVPCNDFTSKGD